ncbi:MAG: Fe-only nitrogenase accessory protein AnfO [Clostridium sp.]|uniref:Fe-only nitrogenase accessory protein AnfO n=1 Tax=Clostridium sp. TaxID=1506 RepID=UPI0039E79749
MEIAVFVNDNGKTISFNESGIINVYSKEEEKWQIIKKIPFDITNIIDKDIICEKMRDMAESLDKCKVIIASEVKGVFYTVLDCMEFDIWTIDGMPEEFLEYVFRREQEEKIEKISIEEAPTPIERETPAHYYIDLRTVMEGNEKVSSKQVLLPFFQNVKFKELEIYCTHVPRWFEDKFKKLNLRFYAEFISEGLVKIKVYPK